MTIPLSELKAEWLKDPAFKAEYDRLAPEFEFSVELLRARLPSSSAAICASSLGL